MSYSRKCDFRTAADPPTGSTGKPSDVSARCAAEVACGVMPNLSGPRPNRKLWIFNVVASVLTVVLFTCGTSCSQRRDTRSAQERAQPAEWSTLRLEVPITEHSAPMAGSANSDSLRIAIKEDGAVYLGSLRISPDDIPPKAADTVRRNPATGVYLWADRRTRYGLCTACGDPERLGTSNFLSCGWNCR
jgi:hypothetical protein